MGRVSIGARSQISFTEETTWGVTPSTPAMRLFRITGGSLNPGRSLIESAELDPSRQRPSPGQGAPFPGLSFNFELQPKVFGILLKHLLTDTVSVAAGTMVGTVDLTAGASVNSKILLVDSDSLGISTITFSGADPINANTIAAQINTGVGTNVATIVSNMLKLYSASITTPTATGYVKVTGGDARTLLGLAVRTEWNYSVLIGNPNLPQGMTFEIGQTDINLYTLFPGSRMNEFSMTLNPNALVTGSLALLSREGGEDWVGSSAAGTLISDFAEKFNTFRGVIEIDGQPDARVRNITTNFTNNMQDDYMTLFTSFRNEVPEGRRVIGGSMGIKFDDATFLNSARDFVESSLALKMETATDQRFIRFFYPSLRLQVPSFDIPEGAIDLPMDYYVHRNEALAQDVVVWVGSGEAIA